MTNEELEATVRDLGKRVTILECVNQEIFHALDNEAALGARYATIAHYARIKVMRPVADQVDGDKTI